MPVSNEDILVAIKSLQATIEQLRDSATNDVSEIRKRMTVLEERVSQIEAEKKATQ